MGRRFLIGGALVAIIGLIVRFVLPLPGPPPYLLTGLIAIGYGLFCLYGQRPAKKTAPTTPPATP